MPNVRDKSRTFFRYTDLTIDDYANTTSPRSRVRKSADSIGRMNRYRDYNVDDADTVDSEEENGRKAPVARTASRSTLPLDVWFLISKFIRPEDVGTFAGICRDTLAVTRSAEFWFHVYRKYIKPGPSTIRLDRTNPRYGLRSRAIRNLYATYPPFVSRTSVGEFHNFYSPKSLLKRKCTSFWYKKHKGQWIFYFKLKLIDRLRYDSRAAAYEERYLESNEVMANRECGRKILKVTCGSFSDAPPVMGSFLNVIYTKVASNMRHNRLHLGFVQGQSGRPTSTSDYSVVLNNVVLIEVFDWWHPEYPHNEESPSPNREERPDDEVPANWFDV